MKEKKRRILMDAIGLLHFLELEEPILMHRMKSAQPSNLSNKKAADKTGGMI
jgi:hypothetical protein